MGPVLRLLPVLFLCASLGGCGSNGPRDSEPPPGVRKNENRNTGVSTSKAGKPYLIGSEKRAP
jgi:hypothetical protein